MKRARLSAIFQIVAAVVSLPAAKVAVAQPILVIPSDAKPEQIQRLAGIQGLALIGISGDMCQFKVDNKAFELAIARETPPGDTKYRQDVQAKISEMRQGLPNWSKSYVADTCKTLEPLARSLKIID